MIDQAAIKRLRKLALAATPGPWRAWLDETEEQWRVVLPDSNEMNYAAVAERTPQDERGTDLHYEQGPDAAYIAAVSPDVVLGLLDALEGYRNTATLEEQRMVARAEHAEAERGRLSEEVRRLREALEPLIEIVYGPKYEGNHHIRESRDYPEWIRARAALAAPAPAQGQKPEQEAHV